MNGCSKRDKIAARQEKAKATIAKNERIKSAAKKRNYCPHSVAALEGVGVDYVIRIAGVWEGRN